MLRRRDLRKPVCVLLCVIVSVDIRVLDGGDGQAVVPPGNYIIQIEVNPAYAPTSKKGGCPRVSDPLTGLCHQFYESNYANNTTDIPVTIPDHPGRSGYGPLAGSKDATYDEDKGH